jgi:hypothetical protein
MLMVTDTETLDEPNSRNPPKSNNSMQDSGPPGKPRTVVCYICGNL